MTTVKHALKHNGAPYTDDAILANPLDTSITSGLGRALCTCGILSEPLATGSARRAWHKAHKAQAAAQSEAMQEVEQGTPEDEVAEALAELVEPAPVVPVAREKRTRTTRQTARAELLEERKAKPTPAPKKASTRRKAEQAAGFMPELDTVAGTTVQVPFTNTVSPHFWFQLGRPAAKVLAEKYPELQVGHDDKARVVTVTGAEDQAQAAAVELAAAWAAAPEVFTTWKKENAAYAALHHTVAEDRRTSYQLTKAFWGNFAREQLLGQ